ncbi:PDZ domain-containing protein [Streptomyces sp. NPDC006186]|uniref:PDZ domain-containing protein n=3 Tax=unclassified Streptomyces TaxID=2593676 RepID=UPI0033B33ED3
MEPTALRPKPMPGRDPGKPRPGGGPAPRRPHAARRRGRRLPAVLCALLAGTVLLLAGVGIGAVGVTLFGAGTLADLRRTAVHGPRTPDAGQAPGASGRPEAAAPATAAAAAVPSASPVPGARASLGVEVMDDGRPGALVVGVHVPGPGYAAGLVRGDLLLNVDRTRIDRAADLARAVAAARPGSEVTLTVRHRSGGYQQLRAVLGVVV